MKVVGILLVSALVVIPAAAALQVAKNFKQAIAFSTCISLISVVLGLVIAFQLDLPASASIVLLSFLMFGILFVFRYVRG
jgi:zinc transport system permease protein